MSSRIQPIFPFKWDAYNSHLKPPENTTLRKIGRVAWNILSILIPIIGLCRLVAYGMEVLARRVILPAAYLSERAKKKAKQQHMEIWHSKKQPESYQILRDHFTACEYTVPTPDGAILSATHLVHAQAKDLTPTVILFQPNGTTKNKNVYRWMQDLSINEKMPCNFVMFDYRGVGDSKGVFKGKKTLLLDGLSIVQWTENTLAVPKEQIYFYGCSLGGAVAMETQALDPDLTGNNGNERSFSSISDTIRHILGNMKLSCLAPLFTALVKKQGYEMSPAEAFDKVKGEKLVAFHPMDPLIGYGASLARKVEGKPHKRIKLSAPPNPHQSIKETGHHCANITHYQAEGTNGLAADRIAAFMFRPPLTQTSAAASG